MPAIERYRAREAERAHVVKKPYTTVRSAVERGNRVYGFEDCLEADGRLPGVVLGHTDTRVRLELTLAQRGGSRILRAVNADSLIVVPTVTSPDAALR